jgi:sugar diacid utilization regulator
MFISVDGFTAWARESGADAEAVDRRREALVRTVEQLGRRHGVPHPLAARRGSVIAFVFPCPEANSDDMAVARRLAEQVLGGLGTAHPDLRFAAGVSACCPLSGNLHHARVQAESALASVSTASGFPVALFDDLGVLRFLLAPGDRGELTGFASNVLGAALDYDLEHSAGLIETVEAYLAEDCSLQRTAERLRVHRKTVRYRLDRVERLTQRKLSSQQDRFEAQLAVTIIRILSLRGRAESDVQ